MNLETRSNFDLFTIIFSVSLAGTVFLSKKERLCQENSKTLVKIFNIPYSFKDLTKPKLLPKTVWILLWLLARLLRKAEPEKAAPQHCLLFFLDPE